MVRLPPSDTTADTREIHFGPDLVDAGVVRESELQLLIEGSSVGGAGLLQRLD